MKRWFKRIKVSKKKSINNKKPILIHATYSFLAVILGFFGAFFKRSKINKKTSKTKVNVNIKENVSKVDKEPKVSKKVVNLDKVNTKEVKTNDIKPIKPVIKKTEKVLYNFHPKGIEQTIPKKVIPNKDVKQLDNKIPVKKVLETPKVIINKKAGVEEKKDVPKAIVENIIKDETIVKEKPIIKENAIKPVMEKEVVKHIITEEDKKNNLMVLNDKLKKIVEKLGKLDKKVNNAKEYNEFYDIEKEMKELSLEVELIKKSYDAKLLKSDNIYAFDEFKLRDNDLMIDELKEYIKNQNKKIDNKKLSLLKPKTVEKKVKKEVKEKQDKVIKQIDEKLLAQKRLIENITRQQKKLRRSLKKPTNKKLAFDYARAGLNKMIFLNFLLAPFGMKSMVLYNLVNAIFINHELKTLHKILDRDAEIQYDVLATEYKSEMDMLMHTYDSYVDSLEELNALEREIVLYTNDITYLNEVLIVKNHVEKEIEHLKVMCKLKDKVYKLK